VTARSPLALACDERRGVVQDLKAIWSPEGGEGGTRVGALFFQDLCWKPCSSSHSGEPLRAWVFCDPVSGGGGGGGGGGGQKPFLSLTGRLRDSHASARVFADHRYSARGSGAPSRKVKRAENSARRLRSMSDPMPAGTGGSISSLLFAEGASSRSHPK